MQEIFLIANFKGKYDDKFNKNPTIEELIKIQEMIENGYKDKKDDELNQIFDYIKNYIIPEKYTLDDLELFIV